MEIEQRRLEEARIKEVPWRKSGYRSLGRQGGRCVRTTARTAMPGTSSPMITPGPGRIGWGEDGLGGISDDKQRLCFALALWNGNDAILKERLFGLTNSEGNHGEDVKEYYF